MDGLEAKGNAGNGGLRDLLTGMRSEPIAPSLSPSPQAKVATETPRAKKGKIFAADLPQGDDVLGFEAALQPLAELAVHRDTEAPLTLGLLGAPGSGKSFALAKLLARAEALSNGDTDRADNAVTGPVASVKIDALALSAEPSVVALAAALYDRLADAFPELAREAAHAVRDPQVVAREAAEELDIGRRRLDAERQKLAELEARRARLPETILFEQAGSQVDSYARANRAKIESRLEGFGITGDAVQNYKSMVRDIAESGGTAARIGAALRSFWAFKGQTRLLLTTVILLLIGVGCGFAFTHQEAWLGFLRSANASFVPVADWMAAHMSWLHIVQGLAFAGAALAVVANLWRGMRFLRPLFRGVGLLETELADRRRDLDSLYAHQMRRVDALAADVELTGRRAAEADRRAASAGQVRTERRVEPSPFQSLTPKSQAERFFEAVGSAIERGWRAGEPASAAPLPHRILVGLDNVDRLPQPKAAELLDGARRALGHSAFITLIAADPVRLAAALAPGGHDPGVLEKYLQIPFRIGTRLGERDYASLVESALGLSETESDAATPESKTNPAPFDWSVSAEEVSLLTALAPLAGQSPRAVKRFANLYRIARSQLPADKAALAFMLALDQGGSAAEIAKVEDALAEGAPEAAFAPLPGSARLDAALAGVLAHHRVTNEQARRAAVVARAFSSRI